MHDRTHQIFINAESIANVLDHGIDKSYIFSVGIRPSGLKICIDQYSDKARRRMAHVKACRGDENGTAGSILLQSEVRIHRSSDIGAGGDLLHGIAISMEL